MIVRRDPYRTLLAAAVTLAVVVLLPIAHLSMQATDNYDLTYAGERQPDDRVVWKGAKLDDLATRIRVALNAAPRNAPPLSVDVLSPANGGWQPRVDTMVAASPMQNRQVAEELAAALFALFGLFVLWWGRDRPSLWLGLFCASFGPPVFQFFGILPEWGMLGAKLTVDILSWVSFFALFALAQTVALEVLGERDRFTAWIRIAGYAALAAVALTAVLDVLGNLLPVVFRVPLAAPLAALDDQLTTFGQVAVLCLGPVLLLTIAALRAPDASKRTKALVILLTTVFAVSGVFVSIWTQLIVNHQSPGWESAWFTLLFIPVGFIVTIPAYQVVEVKVVINRILVVAAMTLIIGAVIAVSETWVHGMVKNWIAIALGDPKGEKTGWALEFIIAFLIVLSFSTMHQVTDETFKHLVFRRRDEAVKELHAFAAHRASFITAREPLLEQAATLVRHAVGASGTAIYEECAHGFEAAYVSGPRRWPHTLDMNDPVLVAMRSERERVDLAAVHATPSALGSEGLALRMAVGGRVIGVVAVGPRVSESDGAYGPEEMGALDDVARGIADALFNLRANETAHFVRAVAEGRIGAEEARRRAETLCGRGLAGFEAMVPRAAIASVSSTSPGT